MKVGTRAHMLYPQTFSQSLFWTSMSDFLVPNILSSKLAIAEINNNESTATFYSKH